MSKSNNLSKWANYPAGVFPGGGSGTGFIQPTVKDSAYGAVGDNVKDDTNAFSLAAKNAPASMNMLKTNFTTTGGMAGYVEAGVDNVHDIAPTVSIRIPAGTYKITSLIDVGNRDVVWLFDSGAVVPNFQYLNGRIVHEGHRVSSKLWGIGDMATGFGVLAGVPLEMMAPTTGFTTPEMPSQYTSRDQVGISSHIQAPPPAGVLNSCTFTPTTATSTVGVDVKKLKKGMLVDTTHTTKYTGWLKSWSSDGKTITVDAWRLQGTGSTGTPTGGFNCKIDPNTKIWSTNFNSVLVSNSDALSADICEGAVFNWQGNKAIDGSPWGNNSYVWGFDSLCAQYRGNVGYLARENWWYGFMAKDSVYGFNATNCSTASYIATNAAGSAYFAVKPAYAGYIELGHAGTAGQPFIGFRSSIYSTDSLWDVQIYADGGNGNMSQGNLVIGAENTTLKNIKPIVDNGYACGNSSYRWSSIWAVNGTIQTSDAREKTDIKPLDADICDLLVDSIKPVSFKRLSADDTPETFRTITQQKTIKTPHQKEVVKFDIVDGKAVKRITIENIETDEPVWDEYPVFDENGIPVFEPYIDENGCKSIRQVVHKVPVMEEVKISNGPAVHGRVSDRRHFGVIAQQVEDAINAAGIDSKDFAALIKDAETGKYGIRYEELLMILWPVVQSLSNRVKTLEGA